MPRLPEEAFYTHEYGMVFAQVLGYLLAVLVVVLSDESALYVVYVFAYLAFAQYHVALVVAYRHEYALKHVQFVVGHGAVFACQFAGNIPCSIDTFFHNVFLL